MDLITSTRNPGIKEILKLEKSRERKTRKSFLVEGFREINRAVKSGYEFNEILYCPELKSFTYSDFIHSFPAGKKIAVASNVFSKIAYRENHDGLLAVAKMKDHSIENLKAKEKALYVVAESVEKPGNLGALLRTADAAGVDTVFICDNQTDIYNPNVVRSSLGCLFSTRVIQSSSENVLNFFRKNKINIYSAALQESKLYYEVNFKDSCAIILGTESQGLSGLWRNNADHLIRIPMAGIADSLNVSVSAAVLIFEAVRQRNS